MPMIGPEWLQGKLNIYLDLFDESSGQTWIHLVHQGSCLKLLPFLIWERKRIILIFVLYARILRIQHHLQLVIKGKNQLRDLQNLEKIMFINVSKHIIVVQMNHIYLNITTLQDVSRSMFMHHILNQQYRPNLIKKKTNWMKKVLAAHPVFLLVKV